MATSGWAAVADVAVVAAVVAVAVALVAAGRTVT